MENRMEYPQKLIIELSYDLAVPFLCIYIQKNCKQDLEVISSLSFITVLFTMAKICKHPKCCWLENE